MKPLIAEDIMTREVITIPNDATVYQACMLMAKEGVSCLVVKDLDGPVGMLTHRDMIDKIVIPERDPKKIHVDQIMSYPIITVDAGTDVSKVSALMTRKSIKQVPVIMSEQSVAGILTQTDLVDNLPLMVKYEIMRLQHEGDVASRQE